MAKKQKSNDAIPADEMILAEALAAANARGLKWCSGAPFNYEHNKVTACCAIGAIALAKAPRKALSDPYAVFYSRVGKLPLTGHRVYGGNDWERYSASDQGETLGRAFRYAMTID